MTEKIYIVVLNSNITGYINFIESVWTTEELARSGILYHSQNSGVSINRYRIIEREINKAKR